jgi:hypothetical protein
MTFNELINSFLFFLSLVFIGIGADPNYGSFIARPNSASSGDIMSISYNPNSPQFGALINPNYNNLQPQQQNYMYGSNYNPGYGSNINYNNQFFNRYPPGSQGWYATGGNYWFNNGKSVTAHPCLLLLTIAILVFVNKK